MASSFIKQSIVQMHNSRTYLTILPMECETGFMVFERK